MFDWPAQIQTSPTSTSRISTWPPVREPAMDRARGTVLTASGASCTFHSPAASAVACRTWPPKRTVTSSPAAARPQTGTGRSACSTIPELKIQQSSRAQARPGSSAARSRSRAPRGPRDRGRFTR